MLPASIPLISSTCYNVNTERKKAGDKGQYHPLSLRKLITALSQKTNASYMFGCCQTEVGTDCCKHKWNPPAWGMLVNPRFLDTSLMPALVEKATTIFFRHFLFACVGLGNHAVQPVLQLFFGDGFGCTSLLRFHVLFFSPRWLCRNFFLLGHLPVFLRFQVLRCLA